jgi:hypothetical protein
MVISACLRKAWFRSFTPVVDRPVNDSFCDTWNPHPDFLFYFPSCARIVHVLLCTYFSVRIVVHVFFCTYCCARIHWTQNPNDVNPVVLGPEIEGATNSEKSRNGARTRASLATSNFLFVLSSHRIATSNVVLQDMKFTIIPWLQSAFSVFLKAMWLFSVVSQQIIRQFLSAVTAFHENCADCLLSVN